MKASDIFFNPSAYANLRVVMDKLDNAHDVATVIMHELHKAAGSKTKTAEESAVEINEVIKNLVSSLGSSNTARTTSTTNEHETPATDEPRTGEGTVKWEAGDAVGTYVKHISENSVELAIALPGIRREDVSVEIQESNDKFFVLAIEATGEVAGKITKGIRIPARYDSENIAARVENGLLFLGLSVKAKARARTVPVM